MSKFSGKCDLYDTLFMNSSDPWYSSEEFRRSVELIVDGKTVRNECEKDLVPYYGYVAGTIASTKGKGMRFVTGARSWVDFRDMETLSYMLADAKHFVGKERRAKRDITEEDVVSYVSERWTRHPRECAEVVKLFMAGNRGTCIPDVPSVIRLETSDFYRDELVGEMLKWGYSEEEAHEWCYFRRRTWK